MGNYHVLDAMGTGGLMDGLFIYWNLRCCLMMFVVLMIFRPIETLPRVMILANNSSKSNYTTDYKR